MSQVSQLTLDNTAFGTFRSNLNSSLQALNSMHMVVQDHLLLLLVACL